MSESKKFQWSKFSQGREEQVVVRADTFDEFTEAIELAKGVLPTTGTVDAPNPGQFPEDEPGKPLASQGTPPPQCPVHHKFMRQGKYPHTWYCPTKVGEGWCQEGRKVRL